VTHLKFLIPKHIFEIREVNNFLNFLCLFTFRSIMQAW